MTCTCIINMTVLTFISYKYFHVHVCTMSQLHTENELTMIFKKNKDI